MQGSKNARLSRSEVMSRVKSKGTSIELAIRKIVWAAGYRYRLHVKTLPGSPDIVLPARRRVIFVNGCFWHGHSCRHGARRPKANAQYWEQKIARNMQRDRQVVRQLKKLGWKPIVVWECALKKPDSVARRLLRFLEA